MHTNIYVYFCQGVKASYFSYILDKSFVYRGFMAIDKRLACGIIDYALIVRFHVNRRPHSSVRLERWSPKPGVAGSNPAGGANFIESRCCKDPSNYFCPDK